MILNPRGFCMKIFIRDIRQEGLHVIEPFPPEALGFTKDDVVRFSKPLIFDANIERVNDTVLARVNVTGDFESCCARCIEPVDQVLNQEINVDYAIDRSTEFIEMDEDIRQEVVINLPLRVLCQKDCKGLCLGCGVNLNNESCKCKKQG